MSSSVTLEDAKAAVAQAKQHAKRKALDALQKAKATAGQKYQTLQQQKEGLEQQLLVLMREHGLALARVTDEREAWAERARELARRLQQLQEAHRRELEQVREGS